MARVDDIDVEKADPAVRAVLKAQETLWGGPLLNHLLYARRPSIFKGVRAMWSGIGTSGLIEPKLQALINRRVAWLNHCEF
ncbi:MAG: hypothetical protein ABI837_05460 [Acidobacteriota bacterium]